MAEDALTPIQRKMMVIMADGLPHSREELHGCLADDLGPLSNIYAHISIIRKHLRPKGHDIICEIHNRSVHYRHVRLLSSAYDGRT